LRRLSRRTLVHDLAGRNGGWALLLLGLHSLLSLQLRALLLEKCLLLSELSLLRLSVCVLRLRLLRLCLCLGLSLLGPLSSLLLLAVVWSRAGCNVEAVVDLLRDGLDFRPELLFNTVQVETIFVCDEVDGKTEVPEPAGATNTVKVGLRVLGKVEVDDNVDGLDVDAAREEVGAHQVSADAITEVMEDAVAVGLQHLRMRVETRITELCDLLRQKLDAVGRVTKYDRLIDLELERKR
jgi:hypothetical protein